MKTKPCFVIAHRYSENHICYLEHFINNIEKFYGDVLIIIIDNNSPKKLELLNNLENKKNIVVLENNTEHKFENGAYLVGVNYLINNGLIDKYDYYVFTQDTYILKNKYDFDELINNNVYACPISFGCGTQDFNMNEIRPHVENLGLWDDNLTINYNTALYSVEPYSEKFQKQILHCFCSVYIIHSSKIKELFEYLKKIKIVTRRESELNERYFAWVLYYLNNKQNYQIDINPYSLYDMNRINLMEDFNHGYFAKHKQGKTEKTL